MEVGRRSLSSENEFRERRRSMKKKMGSLPLAMILSFNDKDVHPDCPNVSNPYHKCGLHCLGKIPSGEYFLDAIRSDEDREWEKKSEKKGVNSNCPYASNPYHKCTEYCLEKLSEKRQDAGKDKPAEKSKDESAITATMEQRMDLEDKNASNLSHECLEYCSERVPERDRHEEVIRLKRFDSQCKHASMLHHECTEFCFKHTPDRIEGEISEGDCMETDKHVHSSPKHASSPYYKVTEYYFEDTSEKEQPEEAINPKEGEIVEIVEQGVNLECISASNPDYVRAEFCFQSVPGREQHGQTMKPKEERKVVTAKRGVHIVCKYSSNPYHECSEYCFQRLPIEDQLGKALMKSKENKEVIVPLERVNPHCQHASNPYHVCAEYCFQNVSNEHHPRRSRLKSKEEKKVVASPRGVNLDCKNALNPYHVCAEYCFENFLEKDLPKQTIKKVKEAEKVVLQSERGVNPECKFASNPYHVCAEYCFQNGLEREQHGQVMKLKSLKELKHLVSNKKITSGHPQCEYASNPYHKCAENCFNKNMPGSKIPDGVMKTNERKKERTYAQRRDDNPKYKNASNFFHGCAEYCPEEISPKNETVEGTTATLEEKKRNSSKEKKRNHPIVEKISLNSEYMEASKSSHKFIESYEGIILQDGPKKSGMNFKYVEAFNPIDNNFNMNNRISKYMPDETKDLQSAKVLDMKNPKCPTGASPLHIDASDLFHEWSKYCSQTKVSVDEIVEQENKVGMGEFTTRNGKGNGTLKDHDSANMEKVQATWGFPRSLPISLLFLLGFILALLHWTQVIHSLVMSSEKNEEPERMKHERHLNPKCKEAYDRYPKCSHYCFPGVGEERH